LKRGDSKGPNSKSDSAKTIDHDGIETNLNSVPANAATSIRSNREFGSNVTELSNQQEEKHEGPKIITDDGITIDFNPLPENADCSIRSNLDPLSNITESSDLHSAKLDSLKTITDDGITIDFKHIYKMLISQFVPV
jgi:hypothetical protein